MIILPIERLPKKRSYGAAGVVGDAVGVSVAVAVAVAVAVEVAVAEAVGVEVTVGVTEAVAVERVEVGVAVGAFVLSRVMRGFAHNA